MPLQGRKFSSNSYKYGFNGQLKDDEIYGAGNLNSAEFWEYDTRLGRRWNMDPEPTIGVSDYACFLNNPIRFNDVEGNTARTPEIKHFDKLEKYKSKNRALLKNMNAAQIEFMFKTSKTWTGKLVQNTNYYKKWESAVGITSAVTSFPLQTQKSVVLSSGPTGSTAKTTSASGEVPFQSGTVRLYTGDLGYYESEKYNINMTITTEGGVVILNQNFNNNISGKTLTTKEVPFVIDKPGKVKITITETGASSGKTNGAPFDATFTPNIINQSSPAELAPDAKPKYDLKKK
jgi:hypothetical protein